MQARSSTKYTSHESRVKKKHFELLAHSFPVVVIHFNLKFMHEAGTVYRI